MEFKYIDGHLYKVRSDRSLSHLKARSKCNGKPYYSYREGGRTGKTCYVHRKIWGLHNGAIPPAMVIDHINGDTLDNRIENLQCITQAENLRKQRVRSDNVTGHKNISYLPTNGPKAYRVRFTKDGQVTRLGGFLTLQEAIAARDEYLLAA